MQAGDVKIRDYGLLTLGQTLARPPILDMPSDEQLDGWANLIKTVREHLD